MARSDGHLGHSARGDNDGDPAHRVLEVAAILAAGVIRLRSRVALPVAPDEHSAVKVLPDSGQDCLELPGETVLSVTRGVNGSRDRERRTP